MQVFSKFICFAKKKTGFGNDFIVMLFYTFLMMTVLGLICSCRRTTFIFRSLL